ncbi:MAG: transcription-repair coupling factor, partial [Gammaproteobacteria bacterium]|nr:transcription-repair coupling factor [Gammaproteobacteria bacterium]
MQAPNDPVLPTKPGEVLNWRKLFGSASSLAVAELATQQGMVVLVCSETAHVSMLEKELAFYLDGRLPVQTFPDWECLPYDRVSPHPDIVSQRLLALHQLPGQKQGVLIVPITALMQRLAPAVYIDG